MYKDPNHKPEIAVPFPGSSLRALCGFRPYAEIQLFVEQLPELQRVVQTDPRSTDLAALYSRLMRAPPGLVAEQLTGFLQRVGRPDFICPAGMAEPIRLAQELYSQFPGDVGVWSAFFLNEVRLEGDAQFLFCAPNEPHAYLEGDCVECMACSDNVVRAGLTPKAKDVSTLLRMLTYKHGVLHEFLRESEDNHRRFAVPTVDEFRVISVVGSQKMCHSGPSIFFAVPGTTGTVRAVGDGAAAQTIAVAEGLTMFVCADTDLEFSLSDGGHVFVATV